MFRVTLQAVSTVLVVLLEINVLSMATVLVALDTCTEGGVRTSIGNHRIALQDVEMVRNQSNHTQRIYLPQRPS